MNQVASTQLAQLRPNVTTAVELFDPPVALDYEITRIFVTSGTTGATATIYHDDDGTVRTADTRIFVGAIAANTTVEITSEALAGGIVCAAAGTLGCQSSVADELTFTVYGIPRAQTQQR